MIFAAGLGTRLKPLTDTTPKAMIPVGGRPLLEHLILKMKDAGVTEIMINVHHFAEQIINFVKENNSFGLHIEFSDERELLLDTGGGLRKAQHFFDDGPFLVHNVDILSNLDFSHLLASHKASGAMATLVVSARDTARYLLFDSEANLRGWTNIMTGELRPHGVTLEGLERLAFSGIQVLSPELFALMEHFPQKFSMIDVYLQSLAQHTLRGYVPEGFRMMDVGKIDTLDQAERFLF